MGNLPDGSNGLQVNHETGSEKEANGSRTNSGTDQNDRVEVTDGTSSENEVNRSRTNSVTEQNDICDVTHETSSTNEENKSRTISSPDQKIIICQKSKELVIFSAICVAGALFVMIGYSQDTFLSFENKENQVEEKVEAGNSSICPYLTLMGDEYCDDEANTPECLYDSGDCCSYDNDRTLCEDCFCYDDATTNQDYSQWLCNEEQNSLVGYMLGDGKCNLKYNYREYYFDIGDCCFEDTECLVDSFPVDCPDQLCVPSNNYCIAAELGDGLCQDHNNGKFCDFDLGDCALPQIHDSCCFCECHCNCHDQDHCHYAWLLS